MIRHSYQRAARRLGISTVAYVFSAVLLVTIATESAAHAQILKVLYTFTGGADGASPNAGLTLDKAGNLIGTTYGGGTGGQGTVFQLKHSGTGWAFSSLYSFTGGSDGANPSARAIFGPGGAVYGTTVAGGSAGCQPYGGCGTVYKLAPPSNICLGGPCPWTESVLYRFTGSSDGAEPAFGDLAFDAAGNLYGSAQKGGLQNCGITSCGVVFQLTPSQGSWSQKVLYAFGGPPDGGFPLSGVVQDGSGNLYGTTHNGGLGLFGGTGTIFRLTPSGAGWSENIIHKFVRATDGDSPTGGLIFDKAGNLYGTTNSDGPNGGGTVFKLSRFGNLWIYGLLYSFPGSADSACGPFGALLMDQAGNLFGTTACDGAYQSGNIFELSPSVGGWVYKDLYDFTGGNDGDTPISNVVMDNSGNLYGTAAGGGALGHGIVWELVPGTETLLVGAPNPEPTYYGLCCNGDFSVASEFTLSTSHYVTRAELVLLGATGYTALYDLALQNSLTGAITTYASTVAYAPLDGENTLALGVDAMLPAGTYYLVATADPKSTLTVPGWYVSDGTLITKAGTVANGVWFDSHGGPWHFETGNINGITYNAPTFTVYGTQ